MSSTRLAALIALVTFMTGGVVLGVLLLAGARERQPAPVNLPDVVALTPTAADAAGPEEDAAETLAAPPSSSATSSATPTPVATKTQAVRPRCQCFDSVGAVLCLAMDPSCVCMENVGRFDQPNLCHVQWDVHGPSDILFCADDGFGKNLAKDGQVCMGFEKPKRGEGRTIATRSGTLYCTACRAATQYRAGVPDAACAGVDYRTGKSVVGTTRCER